MKFEIYIKPSWSETTVKMERNITQKYPIGAQILTWNVPASYCYTWKIFHLIPKETQDPLKKKTKNRLFKNLNA